MAGLWPFAICVPSTPGYTNSRFALKSESCAELDLAGVGDGGGAVEGWVGGGGVEAGPEGSVGDEVVAVVEGVEGFGEGFEMEALA